MFNFSRFEIRFFTFGFSGDVEMRKRKRNERSRKEIRNAIRKMN